MPVLAVRDTNVPVPPPASRKDGKHAAATKPVLPAQPALANPLIAQRCIAFLTKLQMQYDASQTKPTHSSHPALPELNCYLAALASSSATLLQVGSAYEVVGHWLHNCEKYTQAAAILRNAATVYDACHAAVKALLARIDVGRALNAAVAQQQQHEEEAEQDRQAEVQQAEQHWLIVQEQVRGKELRLESYACYHHGQLSALLAGRCGRADVEQSTQLFERAMDVWAALSDIPNRYAPTVRAADGEQMSKHRQHVLRVEEAVSTAAQQCALYGQRVQQSKRLQWLANCLTSALLHLPAAVSWLQCAIIAAAERDCSGARHFLSQAEVSHSQPAAVTATTLIREKVAMYELRYAILHFQVSVLLHSPSVPPPPIPAPLATLLSQPLSSLSFYQQILRAQLLSVVSRLENRQGRVSQSESHCREEYKVWSSCLRRLFAGSTTASVVTSSIVAADVAANIAAQPPVTHEQYAVAWSYIDCLYRYARLMEQQGQPLLCIAHLSKAVAVCESLDEHKQRRRLDRLRWRVRAKLGWQHERLNEGSDVKQLAAEREKWEVAADEALQSLEAALVVEQQSGSDRLMQTQLSAELGDVYLRRCQLHTASVQYQQALTSVSKPAAEQPAVATAQQPDTVKRKARTATTRATKQLQRQQQPLPAEDRREAESTNDRALLQQAKLQAKLASIALSSLVTSHCSPSPSAATASSLEDAVATLMRSSTMFQQHQQQAELAWATYWQVAAQRNREPSSPSTSRSAWLLPTSSTRCIASDPSSLRSCCTSACNSLLYSAIKSSFSSSPPFVSRLLYLSLSSSLGLPSPLDSIFALNASLGIATRHSANRSLRLRSTATSTDDQLSEQLSAIRLSDDSGRYDRSMCALDGGVEQDRERFEREFVARLPAEWTVVTMALADDRRHLLVSRLQSPHHALAPVLLRLPLSATSTSSSQQSASQQESSAAPPPPRTVRSKSKVAVKTSASLAATSTAAAAATMPLRAAHYRLPSSRFVRLPLCAERVLRRVGGERSSEQQHSALAAHMYVRRAQGVVDRERATGRPHEAAAAANGGRVVRSVEGRAVRRRQGRQQAAAAARIRTARDTLCATAAG